MCAMTNTLSVLHLKNMCDKAPAYEHMAMFRFRKWSMWEWLRVSDMKMWVCMKVSRHGFMKHLTHTLALLTHIRARTQTRTQTRTHTVPLHTFTRVFSPNLEMENESGRLPTPPASHQSPLPLPLRFTNIQLCGRLYFSRAPLPTDNREVKVYLRQRDYRKIKWKMRQMSGPWFAPAFQPFCYHGDKYKAP